MNPENGEKVYRVEYIRGDSNNRRCRVFAILFAKSEEEARAFCIEKNIRPVVITEHPRQQGPFFIAGAVYF